LPKPALIVILILSGIPSFVFSQDAGAFEFVENKGQWDERVKFRSEIPNGAFFLRANGFTVLQHHPDDMRAFNDRSHGMLTEGSKSGDPEKDGHQIRETKSVTAANTTLVMRSHAYSVQFLNASPNPTILPDKIQSHYNNYILGDDPSRWAGDVRIFGGVTYKEIYPGIDLRYYGEGGYLKYDLIIHPGANTGQIAMKYVGADELRLTKANELIVRTSTGENKEMRPYAYQYINGAGRKTVDCKFVLEEGNIIRFRVKDRDPNATLIIDPLVIFSTFSGGPNNYGFTATPGPDGSLFAGGIIFSSGFPTSTGAFQRNFQGPFGDGGTDMIIIKFNATGTQRVYSTYLGGSSNDFPHSLFCDPLGQLVVMGRSYSTNFPATVPAVGTGLGCNIVVSKLNAGGSALIGSMKIGGTGNDGVNIVDNYNAGSLTQTSLLQNYGDESRSEVVMDNAGNIYVAGNTSSTDFPVTAGAYQRTKGTGQDGVVIKINPNCNALLWATYLGGNGNDGSYVLEINPITGNIFVAGATASNNFPVNPAGVIQSTFGGGNGDGYVAILSNDGSTLLRATYLGTNNLDIVYGIKFDKLGFPYVMGTTRGTWPVVNAQPIGAANSKQFVSKLKPDLSAFEFSTVFGNGSPKPSMSPVAFLVDRCENMYISGWGGWISNRSDPFDMGSIANMPLSTNAFKRVTDNRDFYFIVIRKNASGLEFGSYFGQDGGEGEHVDGGTSRFDAQGVIYQAICANCFGGSQIPLLPPGFPVTPGVVGPVNGSGINGCNLAAIKILFDFAGVNASPQAYFNGKRSFSGCFPGTIEFRDSVKNAKSYEWNFGDGSPVVSTTLPTVNYDYRSPGVYNVRLIAIDSNTCNIRDTAYLTINIRTDKANLGFTSAKLPPCESLAYSFNNTSQAPAGRPFGSNSFIWNFGDGSRITAGAGPVTHTYTAPGTYRVWLVLNDTLYCNHPDSIEAEIRITPNTVARFEVPDTACAPFTAVFDNTTLGGQSFYWDFGDGNTSTAVNPTHIYQQVGTYVVKLIATDPNTCNRIDSTTRTIRLFPDPISDFTYAPIPPEVNRPTVFTNLSSGGVRYRWEFGDGFSAERSRYDTITHQYRASGTYNACLIVYNQFECTDTLCRPVQALIEPLLDVPNAFTPGRFGKNSTIKVEGFGILKMTWRIYNRWGVKLFESTDPDNGWDGTYNGQPQPMDVYAYTLEVEFSNNTRARKTGDITLIR
jgi:gliding motility-associated-like protein